MKKYVKHQQNSLARMKWSRTWLRARKFRFHPSQTWKSEKKRIFKFRMGGNEVSARATVRSPI